MAVTEVRRHKNKTRQSDGLFRFIFYVDRVVIVVLCRFGYFRFALCEFWLRLLLFEFRANLSVVKISEYHYR